MIIITLSRDRRLSLSLPDRAAFDGADFASRSSSYPTVTVRAAQKLHTRTFTLRVEQRGHFSPQLKLQRFKSQSLECQSHGLPPPQDHIRRFEARESGPSLLESQQLAAGRRSRQGSQDNTTAVPGRWRGVERAASPRRVRRAPLCSRARVGALLSTLPEARSIRCER